MLQLAEQPSNPAQKTPARRTGASESEIREAQKLRYRIFAEELGARLPTRTPGIDIDLYDPYCEHLIVRDEDNNRIVGTYRILSPHAARRVGGYYSENEFDLTRLQLLREAWWKSAAPASTPTTAPAAPSPCSGPASPATWRRATTATLIGCASIGMADGGHIAANLYSRLGEHMAPPEYRVFPRHPLPVEHLFNDQPAELPPLIKGYLRAGAYIGGEPAWDPDFNTADLLIMLPMRASTSATRGISWKRRPHDRCVPPLTRVGLHLGYGLATAALVYPLIGRPAQLKLKQRWSRQLLGMLGVRLQAEAAPLPSPTLLVANHISWLDIYVINALAPAAFVCKADVRDWPLIGWLCERTETVFMPRGSRRGAREASGIVAARLRQGWQVAVFPEGTTSDGSEVLPFHGALLQGAVDAGCRVQPLALRYTDEDGRPSTAAAYCGDTSLLQSLRGSQRRPACTPASTSCRRSTAAAPSGASWRRPPGGRYGIR
jgi:1-acyl-sn-glycerol-3-phosphate acyltransferase